MVIWTNPAKTDLKHIFDYIAYDSKYYAKKVRDDIVAKTELLLFNPESGSIVSELNIKTIKQLFSYDYRIIYEIKNKDCYILAILRSKQDIKRNIKVSKN